MQNQRHAQAIRAATVTLRGMLTKTQLGALGNHEFEKQSIQA